jgi:hypothetical protein
MTKDETKVCGNSGCKAHDAKFERNCSLNSFTDSGVLDCQEFKPMPKDETNEVEYEHLCEKCGLHYFSKSELPLCWGCVERDSKDDTKEGPAKLENKCGADHFGGRCLRL